MVFGGISAYQGSDPGAALWFFGVTALVFGFGAAHLGPGQLFASESRGGRLIGFALVLGGFATVVDAARWVLSGAGL